MRKVRVQIQNRDWAEASQNSKDSPWQIEAFGCFDFLVKVKSLREQLKNKKVSELNLLEDRDHSSLLLNELILKMQNRFVLPYQEEELCHCRHIPTSNVQNALLAGNLSLKAIGQICGAGVSCGSCKPDIEALIAYYQTPRK